MDISRLYCTGDNYRLLGRGIFSHFLQQANMHSVWYREYIKTVWKTGDIYKWFDAGENLRLHDTRLLSERLCRGGFLKTV